MNQIKVVKKVKYINVPDSDKSFCLLYTMDSDTDTLLYGKIYSKYYYYFLKIYEKTYNTFL
jgi:hypothetical protein